MPAEDILSDADVAEFRALTADLAFPDHYEVLGLGAKVKDGAGGWTQPKQTIERGRCAIAVAGSRGGERAAMARLGWTSGYSIELRYDTLLAPEHELVAGGRTFQVGEVLREGRWGIAATAVCQERGGT